jgi:hypothetical protein
LAVDFRYHQLLGDEAVVAKASWQIYFQEQGFYYDLVARQLGGLGLQSYRWCLRILPRGQENRTAVWDFAALQDSVAMQPHSSGSYHHLMWLEARRAHGVLFVYFGDMKPLIERLPSCAQQRETSPSI